MPTTGVPAVLTDPGYLFWAPLLTTEPANTVVASKFTDAWPVGWASLGATEDGGEFSYAIKVEPVTVAEFLDPIRYATTERTGSFAMTLANWTATNLKYALNGGVLTVTGTTTTTMTKVEPPTPGAEVRCMIGWESLDSTARIVCRQTINGAELKTAFKKAPTNAGIPVEFNFEVPPTGTPFSVYTAGLARG